MKQLNAKLDQSFIFGFECRIVKDLLANVSFISCPVSDCIYIVFYGLYYFDKALYFHLIKHYMQKITFSIYSSNNIYSKQTLKLITLIT